MLRCAWRGGFVDWVEARLLVVGARPPRLDLPPVLVREAAGGERAGAIELFRRDFWPGSLGDFSEEMCPDRAPVVVAEMNWKIAGFLAHRLAGAGLHVTALATDPTWQRSGVGGYLVAEAELLARRRGEPNRVRRHSDPGRDQVRECHLERCAFHTTIRRALPS